MNRDLDYGTLTTNEIAALSSAGYFAEPANGIHTLRALAALTNSSVSLEFRVRSYLAATCSHCHEPGGLAHALWDARISTTTANAGIINGTLVTTTATRIAALLFAARSQIR